MHAANIFKHTSSAVLGALLRGWQRSTVRQGGVRTGGEAMSSIFWRYCTKSAWVNLGALFSSIVRWRARFFRCGAVSPALLSTAV